MFPTFAPPECYENIKKPTKLHIFAISCAHIPLPSPPFPFLPVPSPGEEEGGGRKEEEEDEEEEDDDDDEDEEGEEAPRTIRNPCEPTPVQPPVWSRLSF